ncbi:MAG: efflux RND transporter permease subunit, partial [Pseudomonadota bacterium]
GQQIRGAFEGQIATRFARGDEEVTVRVLREQTLQGRADLERLYLRAPNGENVPLSEVATLTERRTFAIVTRRNGLRTVSVTADIDSDLTSTARVLAQLERDVMPGLVEKYNVKYEYRGRAQESAEAFQDLRLGTLVSFMLIYIILAWVFGHYLKPFAVMLIVPFGFVGAVVGHYVMGYPLTMISMIGLLGLSGILVNDSIVLVSRIQERLTWGEGLHEACVAGSCDRFRAVLLTSLTTIGGLTPLLFETSLQAQFLIPMAVTMVFGLLAATILVLVLVPSLLAIGSDISTSLRSFLRFAYGDGGADTPRGGEPPLRPEPAE